VLVRLFGDRLPVLALFFLSNFYITDNVLPSFGMEVVSAKIDKKTKERMQRHNNVNWSETIRDAIRNRLDEEELKERHFDLKELQEASRIADSIRKPSPSGWDSTMEIRKWRDVRRRK
jgi:hypothetical protein